MKTKALLVDGHAGAQGPAVNLEGGVWEIDAHSHVEVRNTGGKVKHLPGLIKIIGPSRIVTLISKKYSGPPIHLQARQVAV